MTVPDAPHVEIIRGRALAPGAFFRVNASNPRLPRPSSTHWADYDRNGILVAQGTHPFVAPTPEELKAWKPFVARVAKRYRSLNLPDAPLFIRFGRPPKEGQSRNYATGMLERGISAYQAEYNPDTGLMEYAGDTGLGGAVIHLMLTGKQAYLLTGRVVGTGSDGEPLLAEVSVVAKLKPEQNGFAIPKSARGSSSR